MTESSSTKTPHAEYVQPAGENAQPEVNQPVQSSNASVEYEKPDDSSQSRFQNNPIDDDSIDDINDTIYSDELLDDVARSRRNERKDVELDDLAHLSIWDFAGQEVFFDSHRMFLCEDGIYIFVFNVEEWANHVNNITNGR